MAKKNLLLVDADSKTLRMLEISLRKAGFSVTTAISAVDAEEKVRLCAPDLVITDTELPGETDGLELVARLKQRPEFSAIPIIFLSSEDRLEQRVRGIELGVQDHLAKPVFLQEVLTRVRVLLEKIEKERLARRERSAPFTGTLDELGLVDLVQTLESGRKTGQLHLQSRGHAGTILFREGKVIDARVGRLGGERAFYRMLVWNEGTCATEFGPHDAPDVIELSTQGLLLEGMRRVDEWGRLLEQLPPPERALEVDYGKLTERLDGLPSEVNGILRLCDGSRSLLEVVDESGLGDLEALEICSKLYGEGLLYDVANREPDDEGQVAEQVTRIETWLDEGEVDARADDKGADEAHARTAAEQRAPEETRANAASDGDDAPGGDIVAFEAEGAGEPTRVDEASGEHADEPDTPTASAPGGGDDREAPTLVGPAEDGIARELGLGPEDLAAPAQRGNDTEVDLVSELSRALPDEEPIPADTLVRKEALGDTFPEHPAARADLPSGDAPTRPEPSASLPQDAGATSEEQAVEQQASDAPPTDGAEASPAGAATAEGQPLDEAAPDARSGEDSGFRSDVPSSHDPVHAFEDDSLTPVPSTARRVATFGGLALLSMGMTLPIGLWLRQRDTDPQPAPSSAMRAPSDADAGARVELEALAAAAAPEAPPPTADLQKANPQKADPQKADPQKADPQKADPQKADPPKPAKSPAKARAERYARRLKQAEGFTRAGKFRKAVRAYKSALAVEPKAAAAHVGLGNAFYELNTLEAAVFHLEKARALSGRDPQVFLLLGAVYQSAKRAEDAIAAYERYLALAPSGKFARDVRAILSELKRQ